MTNAVPRLWTQIVQTSAASIVNVIASGLVLAITARALGPQGRGIYAAATGWVVLFATLGSLSLGQTLVRDVAGRDPKLWLPQAVGTALVLVAALSAANVALASAAYFATGGDLFRHIEPTNLTVAFAALPFLIANTNLPFVLYAVDGVAIVNRSMIVGGIALTLATAGLVTLYAGGVTGALAAFAAGSAARTAVMIAPLWRLASSLRFDGGFARRMIAGSAQLHLNSVGAYVIAQSSVLILNAFRPPAETGQYQLALQLLTLALLLSAAIGTVGYGLVATKGPDAAWSEHRMLAIQGIAFALVGAAIAYLTAPVLIRLVAGPSFEPAIHLFRLLTPAIVGATVSTVMASQWVGRGFFWQASVLTIATGVVSIGCDFFFIPRYGMNGAAVSTLASYTIAGAAGLAMMMWLDSRVARASTSNDD